MATLRNLDSILKRRDITLPAKVHLVKAMVFPVVMFGCESWTIKESWVLKDWCFWTVVSEKTLESPWNCKEIEPVHPKGNQPWILIGRAEAEAPILWPPDVKNWLLRKDPDAGKDSRQEEKGTTEDEMFGWHHQLKGHEFEQALAVGDGQGSPACYGPWVRKELDMTEQLNWTDKIKSHQSSEEEKGPNIFTTCYLKFSWEETGKWRITASQTLLLKLEEI